LRRFDTGPRPWVVGHRGAHPEIENTIPSFRQALAEGADFVECDVQLTAEGELVLHHDEALDLAHDVEHHGRRVEELTGEARRRLRLRSPHREEADAALTTLDELFAALPAGTRVNVELKRYGMPVDRIVAAVAESLAGREEVLVSAFHGELLRRLRDAAPDLPLAPLAEAPSPALDALVDEIDAWAVHLGTPPAPATLDRLARPVLVYTVNDVETALGLFARGVAGVFTDHPGALRSALRAFGTGGPGVV
jgi:glycerophosphoryl diester phosphodiesterase